MASLQPEVDKVVAWSDKARLTLNKSKCETTFVSQDCAEVARQHNITIDGKRVFSNPFPVILAVRYDRQLNFEEHVQKLYQSMFDRNNHLCALGGTTCGRHTSDRRHVYIAVKRSMLECAALAPWLSATTISKLEKVLLETARVITGLVRPTPVVVILEESQLPPISTRFQTISHVMALLLRRHVHL